MVCILLAIMSTFSPAKQSENRTLVSLDTVKSFVFL